MGSGGSKASSSCGRKDRSKGKTRVFQSSCLGTLSRSRDTDKGDQVYDHCEKEDDDYNSCPNQNTTESDQFKADSDRKGQVDSLGETPRISSSVVIQEWNQPGRIDPVSGSSGSSVRASLSQSLNPSSRFFSRFSFNPGNVSFRLSRATSLGSSRDYRVSRTNRTASDNDEEPHLHGGSPSGLFSSNGFRRGCDPLSSSRGNRNPRQCDDDTSSNRWSNSLASGSFDNLEPTLAISSIVDDGQDVDGARTQVDVGFHAPRILTEPGYGESGPSDRRIGTREPAERNVRFSRTLSVGRLRDRVLRRTSLSELTNCPMQCETDVREDSRSSDRQVLTIEPTVSASQGNAVGTASTSGYSPSGLSRALFSISDHDVDTSRSREARYRDLLEHRSDFLERRRRIRSQVRALQRLESRFENLSGHERSCILSGQHRTGCCTCRNGNRDANSNDDTNARASISRIVMLAEALFEVLDEIHQQSVVLSSRPSVSAIGSVPAPNEVVDSLPVKLYSKLQKHQNEEAAQCYICLVEYEEGESMRILPCNHEFHRACVDKWLKEIHRVCPLCRGDICRSDSLSTENGVNHLPG